MDPCLVQDYAALVDALDEHPIWRQARLDAIERIRNIEIPRYLREHDTDDWDAGCRQANASCFHIATRPGWLPERPPRRMPTVTKIAQYWHGHPGTFEVDIATPECFRCHLSVPAWSWLERAHLVDRWCGGLDHEANIVMLCVCCHRRMPPFMIDQVAEAISWVQSNDDSELWHGVDELRVEAELAAEAGQ
jgi:hypothetical protein